MFALTDAFYGNFYETLDNKDKSPNADKLVLVLIGSRGFLDA
jgi:hypothetical protein